MRITSLFIAIGLFVATQVVGQTSWKLDKVHSKMTFTVTHLSMSEVDGVFKDYDVTITAANPDFSDAVVEMTADLKTVDTNNEMRNGHLQKDDMFDTANHPTLSFKSTGIKKIAEKKFALTGDLTMKGVTKPVTLDFILLGTGKDRRSQKDMAGFKVSGIINRTDFGVGNMPALVVGHEVELRASGEFVAN